MLERPPDSPYMKDDENDPDLKDLRGGDILMEPEAWEKQDDMYDRYPRPGNEINVCTGGNLVGIVSRGGSVAVNCRDVSKNVGAILVGFKRPKIEDPNLVRPDVHKALSNLKAHIDSALESFFASNDLRDFLTGESVLGIGIPRNKFQGIALDGNYEDFPNLEEIHGILSKPVKYNVPAHRYLNLPRIEWLMALRTRLEVYVRNYVEAHVSASSCFSNRFSIHVNFNVSYLPKMVTTWEYDGRVKLKAHFLRSDARDFILRGLQFKA